MVYTEKGMADADHIGGLLAAYKAEKGWSEKFVSAIPFYVLTTYPPKWTVYHSSKTAL